ncbi:MAG: ETC complex I subunit [Pseudomonadota bacterium]
MQVRIFQPPKTAMQSGRANAQRWVVEFEPESARQVEGLMGWTSSADTKGQLRLRFDSKEEALDYVKRRGLMYTLEEPKERKIKPKSYGENFRFDRPGGRWTH